MEATSVVTLRNRSEERNNLRYTAYIGDGDSKCFHNVLAAKPCGDITIEKEECIGHVQKRLGKGLRDLKQKLGSQKLSNGKPIGGKGRLTDKKIDSLQNYYGMAIRKHASNVTDTARAIWASICHEISTDEKPENQFCPAGDESWCGFARAKAAGTEADYTHKPSIPRPVFDKMRDVYIRLADKPLLQRCNRGATQNANESLNGVIWNLCPKESFCGPATVETAVYIAVALFNHGTAVVEDMLTTLGCNPSHYTVSGLARVDQKRLYHSAKKSSSREKPARKKRRAVKKGHDDAAAEREAVTYAAGGF